MTMKFSSKDYYTRRHECQQCESKDKEIAILNSMLRLTELRLNRVLGIDEAQINRMYPAGKGGTNDCSKHEIVVSPERGL